MIVAVIIAVSVTVTIAIPGGRARTHING